MTLKSTTPLLFAAALCIVACDRQPPPDAGVNANATPTSNAAAIQFTDSTGQDITLPAPPKRIATTATFAVQYLVALDHPPVLRPDVPDQQVSTPAALEIPTLAVDHSAGPNLEQLAAARPNLVITTPTFARFADPIHDALDVPAVVVNIASLDEVVDKARLFGQIIDEPQRGEQLAKQLQQKIDAVQAPDDADAPKVFAIFGTPQAFFAFRDQSYLGSMVRHLGGQLVSSNVTVGGNSPFVPLSLETLLAADPDVILMVHHGPPGQGFEELQDKAVWSDLSAVKQGRVHRLSPEQFLTAPGPDAPEALRELRAILYPDAQTAATPAESSS